MQSELAQATRSGPAYGSARLTAVALGALAGLALAAARGARAEDTPPTSSTSGEDPAAIVRRIGPVEVEAPRPETWPEDPSSFTEVIELDERAGGAASLPDLLEREVGIQVRQFGGEGQRAEISIRGSAPSQVVVLLDGGRLNSAQSGAVDLSTIPLGLLERIEISRGAGSVEVGSDAVGGIVNLITRRPGAEPETRIGGEGGSFETYRASGWRAARHGEWEYSAGYAYFRTEGDFEFQRPVIDLGGATLRFDPDSVERINNNAESHASLVRVGRTFGEQVFVSFSDSFFRVSRGQPGLDSASGETAGQQTEAQERRWRNLAILDVEAVALTPLELDVEATLYHRWERTRFRDPAPDFPPAIDSLNENGALGARMVVRKGVEMFSMRHRGRVALDFRRDTLHSDEFVDQTRYTFGASIQDDVALFSERLRIVPALRFDDTEDFEQKLLPRLGVIAAPFPWLRVRANIERSFRVPNFDELFFPDKGFQRGNPGLAPEEATSWDVGGELAFARLGPFRDVRFTGAYFDQDIDDSILFVLVAPNLVRAENTGPASIQGYELALSFGLTEWLELSGNFTHLDTRQDTSGAPLPGRAANEASGRVVLAMPSGLLRWIGEVHYTDEIPVTDTGSTRVSDRVVFDAGLLLNLARLPGVEDWLPLRDLVVSVRGRDLGDRSIRDAAFFPRSVRSVHVGVEGRF